MITISYSQGGITETRSAIVIVLRKKNVAEKGFS
jgi:hypothetical protein